MLIRRMEQEDIEQVIRIERETFSQPWTDKDFSDSICNMNNHYLIAQENGQVVGYCGYWGIAGEGDIYNIAVKKEYRGRGIGENMLCALIEYAKSMEITALNLEVRASNEPAISLYQKLGFKSLTVRKDFYTKPVEDAVLMRLEGIQ